MTRQLARVTIHRTDDDKPPCLKTLKRWAKAIQINPPRLSWAALFGVPA